MATLRYEEVPIHKVIDKLKKLPLSQKLSDDDFALIISSLREPIKTHKYKVYFCDICGTMHVIYRYFLNYSIICSLYLLYLSGGKLDTADMEEAFNEYYDRIPRHSVMFRELEEKGNYKHIYKIISGKISKLVDFGLAESVSADFINKYGKKVQNNFYKITDLGKDFFEGKVKVPMAIGYTDGDVFDIPKNEDKLVSLYDVVKCKYTQFRREITEKDVAIDMSKDAYVPYIPIDDEDTPKACPNYVYEYFLNIILKHLIEESAFIEYNYLQERLSTIESAISNPDTLIYGIMKHFDLRFCKYKHTNGKVYYCLLSKTLENPTPIMEKDELKNKILSIGKKWSKTYMEAIYDKESQTFKYTKFEGNYYLIGKDALSVSTKELREEYFLD